jgi:hypothetical protein
LVGFLNYYRRYIEGFSEIAALLTELTKKDVLFTYGLRQREAVKELKKRLTKAFIQAVFDPELEATLETDISNYAIEACLTQKTTQKVRIIAFYFKKMIGSELNYDIYNKELFAIVEVLREWRVYLEEAKYPIQIYTDYKNLLYWTITKQLNRRQVRWSETLAFYDIRINYVRGTENGRADALSRRSNYKEGTKSVLEAILAIRGEIIVYNYFETQTLALVDIELTTEQRK